MTPPRAALLAAVVAMLAACSRDTPTVDPVGPAERAPLVSLVRYGGLANAREQVEVYPGGEVTIVTDRAAGPVHRTQPAEDLARLRTALQRSEFATLDREYVDRGAADAFQYDITYQGRTVTTDEGVVPDRLRPALELVVGLLAA